LSKITQLALLTSGVASNDVLPIVDVSDTSHGSASGTTKGITVADLLPGGGSSGITLAGDLGNTDLVPQVISTHLTAPLPVAQGGTGAATADDALASLGGASVASVDAETSRAEAAEAAKGPVLTQAAVQTNLTSPCQAAANQIVPADTTGGPVVVTLPATPPAGTLAAVKQILGTAGVTVNTTFPDVFNKTGGSTTVALTLLNQGIFLQYQAGIWLAISTDAPLSGLDARYLNQNTTGTAGNVTGTVAVGNGGTGATTADGARSALGLSSGATASIDATAGDIAPLGTQAAGATGKLADAGHVHPTTGIVLTSSLPLAVDSGGTGATSATAALTALTGSQQAGYYARSDGTSTTLAAIQAADLPAGTTSTQGALQLDGTATDITPAGTQSAGSTGKAADAGHIHPSTNATAQYYAMYQNAVLEGYGAWTFDYWEPVLSQSVSASGWPSGGIALNLFYVPTTITINGYVTCDWRGASGYSNCYTGLYTIAGGSNGVVLQGSPVNITSTSHAIIRTGPTGVTSLTAGWWAVGLVVGTQGGTVVGPVFTNIEGAVGGTGFARSGFTARSLLLTGTATTLTTPLTLSNFSPNTYNFGWWGID